MNVPPDVSRETILTHDGRRETILTLVQIGDQLVVQIRDGFIPLRELCVKHTNDWWQWQEMIDRNMELIRSCQEQIKCLQEHC